MPPDSYIICATPRSGSTLLCDLLQATGVAGRPASYFRRQSIRRLAERFDVPTRQVWQDEAFDRLYLDAVVREGKAGTGVFGMRLMWESLPELLGRLDRFFPQLGSDAARLEAAFGPSLFLHLSREDKVAQAISLVKAQQTGLWHMASDGTERERTAPPQEPQYDRGVIAAQVETLAEHDRAWESWFEAQGIVPLRLTYEALAEQPAMAVAKVLGALGLDTGIAAGIAPRTARMSDPTSRDWIARFKAEARPLEAPKASS